MILHNMSAPPRSEVKFEQGQLKKYIAFIPFLLASLLGEEKGDVKDLGAKVKQYVSEHPRIESLITKPTGYMIAEVIDLNGRNRPSKDFGDQLNRYQFVECADPELLIAVFCSTVGDLYIPNRTLSFESSKFDKILLFPEEEVMS